MSAAAESMTDTEADKQQRQPSVDELLVQSIARWALGITVGIVLFDVLVAAGYPFPGSSTTLRGVSYSVAGIALLLAAGFIAFLGYRIVSLRFVRRSRAVYVIFLPAVALLSSVVALLFLGAPA
jgi:hypothetical protein